MKTLKTLFLLLLLFHIAGCSDEIDKKKKPATGDHVWKQQTDTLKASKDAAKKMQESLNQNQKKLEQSN